MLGHIFSNTVKVRNATGLVKKAFDRKHMNRPSHSTLLSMKMYEDSDAVPTLIFSQLVKVNVDIGLVLKVSPQEITKKRNSSITRFILLFQRRVSTRGHTMSFTE